MDVVSLAERLRLSWQHREHEHLMREAADRIDVLEAALRGVRDDAASLAEAQQRAHRALEASS